ncbi:MAG: alpha/beta hydrolase [Pirellulales bacterium]|nr:alpha/beta hydrolase [Pirellulales bacterium]
MADGLVCEELLVDGRQSDHWQRRAWSELEAELLDPLPTIVYVHGNRVSSGEDKLQGLALYRSIADRRADRAPLRFIVWSWPSAQIPGALRDYQVKAARTKYVSWQLAWAIDRMPVETPLSMVGYSYGARVVTGSLHLLAGGRMGELALGERQHPSRPPIKAALVAAAVDADWIRPGGYHGRALEQAGQLLLVSNHLDPAMRFYHMAFEGRVRPLGYAGLRSSQSMGRSAKIQRVDVTDAVGRHHALEEYLAATGPVGRVLEQVALFPPPPLPSNAVIADNP